MNRILIVDDSASLRQMIGDTLRASGFQILEAEHGGDALQKLQTSQADLIITDLNMPVMDGISLIERLRQARETSRTPILMLTTEGADAKKAAGRSAGATGWIMKPFDPEKLLAIVAKVLG